MKPIGIIVTSIYLLLHSTCGFGQDVHSLKRDDGTAIQYYLTQLGKNNTSLAVLIQGSDCNSVYHNNLINDVFADIFQPADILIVEKYGIDVTLNWSDDPNRGDCPESYYLNDSPEQRVADYENVLLHLNNKQKYKKIIVLGGSEGAVVANLLTARTSLVDLTISINGGGRWFLDDVLHSIELQSDTEEAYDVASAGFMGFYKSILDNEQPDLILSGHGYSWWREMFEVDQTSIIGQIDTPLLIIQAGKDESVSVKAAVSQVKELHKTKSNITFIVYPELNHSLKNAEGGSEVERVTNDISAWLKSNSY